MTRCDMSASCVDRAPYAVAYEETPGGDALLAFACPWHLGAAMGFAGRPALLLDIVREEAP